MKKLFSAFIALFVVHAAQAVTIDFEELGYGSSVAFNHYQAQGILFDSSVSWSIYNNSGYPKALINDTNFAGDLIGSFTTAVSSLSVLMGDVGGDLDSGTLVAYDSSNNIIATDSVSDTSWFTVAVAGNNIDHFRIFSSGLVVYDTITFNQQTSVPDGGTTVAMLGLALVGVGAARRKFARA